MLIKGIFVSIAFLCAVSASAQTIHEDLQGVWRAKVLAVVSEEETVVPGTETPQTIQTLRVELLEGERKGEVIEIENDFIMLEEGQSFYMNYLITAQADEIFSVRDLDRRGALLMLVSLFALVVVVFGSWQGVRSLVSLAGSLLVIMYVLIPLLINGYNPVLVSILIGSCILAVAIFFTHGFTWNSLVAFGGTSLAIVITGALSFFAIELLHLSGFFSDETVYLNFSTQGLLDFQGLLLGGIIIGVLGVLDDIAITQVAVVAELQSATHTMGSKELYGRALRVGREHVGALVNTIVLAYAGVSLPLLLWFSQSQSSFGKIINNEIFATEIARAVVGSIGLICAVPITTALAVFVIRKVGVKKFSTEHTHAH